MSSHMEGRWMCDQKSESRTHELMCDQKFESRTHKLLLWKPTARNKCSSVYVVWDVWRQQT